MNPQEAPLATTIDLLRHGEPAGGDKYRGSLDDPLSPTGWEQMRRVVSHAPWRAVITSPLRRCREFAEELTRERQLPLEVEEGFREMSFGLWEGRTREELLEQDGERLVRFWQDPLNHPPPQGEHLYQVRDRVMSAWSGLAQRHGGGHLLVISHGGIMRVILGTLLGMPLTHISRLTVPYAALTRVRLDVIKGRPMPRLVFHDGCLDR